MGVASIKLEGRMKRPEYVASVTAVYRKALDEGVVTRPMRVVVRAMNRHGHPFELEGEGLLARAICHELDHLDGHLWIDVADRELTPEEIEGHIPEDDAGEDPA